MTRTWRPSSLLRAGASLVQQETTWARSSSAASRLVSASPHGGRGRVVDVAVPGGDQQDQIRVADAELLLQDLGGPGRLGLGVLESARLEPVTALPPKAPASTTAISEAATTVQRRRCRNRAL
jgi:hypothetical protein